MYRILIESKNKSIYVLAIFYFCLHAANIASNFIPNLLKKSIASEETDASS